MNNKKIICFDLEGRQVDSFDTIEEAQDETLCTKREISFALYRCGFRGGDYYWFYEKDRGIAISAITKKVSRRYGHRYDSPVAFPEGDFRTKKQMQEARDEWA